MKLSPNAILNASEFATVSRSFAGWLTSKFFPRRNGFFTMHRATNKVDVELNWELSENCAFSEAGKEPVPALCLEGHAEFFHGFLVGVYDRDSGQDLLTAGLGVLLNGEVL